MTEHNISYATLSERTGIDKGNINKLFNGNPTLNKLVDVAEAIGIDITDLFYPIEEPATSQPSEHSADLFATPSEGNALADTAIKVPEQTTVQTTAFCPHCGAKVRVGVVLLAE